MGREELLSKNRGITILLLSSIEEEIEVEELGEEQAFALFSGLTFTISWHDFRMEETSITNPSFLIKIYLAEDSIF